jgi:Holliday junction resolvase RusA-like endonuclease
MKFIFYGEPIAKKRHRSRIKNHKIHTYYEQHSLVEALKFEMQGLLMHFELEEQTEIATADAFDVGLAFYLSYPKKFSKRKIKAIEEGLEKCPANTKPDIDNLEKFYLDVGNGILYKDDKEIICVKKFKCYSLNPRTEFTITPHKGIFL